MKKLLFLILAVFFFAGIVSAAETTKSIKLAWQQDGEDFENLAGWKIYLGDATGGPYVYAGVTIPFDPQVEGNSFEADSPLTIEGKPGSTVTKYIVLTAIDQEGGESDYSNEATNPDGSVGVAIKIRIGKPIEVIIEVNP